MTDLVGSEYPIFAFSHCRDVVAAVTNAGGLGVFGATGRSAADVDIDLTWLDEHTRGSYGVDLLLPQKFGVPGSAGEVAALPPGHVAFVEELMRKYDVPALPDDDAARLRAKAARSGAMMDDAAEVWDIAGAHNVVESQDIADS